MKVVATSGNILETIGALYDSLTKTEKRIAKTIMASPELFRGASLSECAQQLDVGDATFIRFCRTLGFSGFSDFKLALSVELATRDQKPNAILDNDITSEDDCQNVALKLENMVQRVLSETINLLDYDQLEQIVKKMRHAKRVFFFGAGSSGVMAEEAKYKFMRIGLNVDASANNHVMFMQASLMNKDDVVIGISHSGYSKETVEALRIAQSSGATTIALTHNLRSPITDVANYVLANGHRQGQLQGDSMGTKIAQLFVLDVVYSLIVQAQEEKAATMKQKTVNVLLEQRSK